MPTMKICSCCGAYAGVFEQWHNRDTGYGLCGKCAKWILVDRKMDADEFHRCYGIEGCHYPSRLFGGHFPCGIVYADRWIEEGGDYKRIAFLPYDTLKLEISDNNSPLLPRIREDAAKYQPGQSLQVAGNCTLTIGTKHEKRFLIEDQQEYSLADMLVINEEDEEVVDWLNSANVGDIWPGIVTVTRIQ